MLTIPLAKHDTDHNSKLIDGAPLCSLHAVHHFYLDLRDRSMQINALILCGALLCAAAGCGYQAAKVAAEQAAQAEARQLADVRRAATMAQYDAKLVQQAEAQLKQELEVNRQVVDQASKAITEHTVALKDDDAASTKAHHQAIAEAEKRKTLAEAEIKRIKQQIARKQPTGG